MKCNYADCAKKPEYYCECQIPSFYICSEHTDQHMKSGNKYKHVCRVLMSPLTADQILSLHALRENLVKKRYEESRVLLESHAKELQSLNSAFHRSLKEISAKFEEFIKQIDIAIFSQKAEYENLLETIFNSIYNQKPYTYILNKSCKNILKIDYFIEKQSFLPVPDQAEIGELTALLELSPGTFFHYGGISNKTTLFMNQRHKIPVSSCGIIDLSNNIYKRFESFRPGRYMPGLVHYDDFIYLFGGFGANGQCLKFNLSSRKWKIIKSIDKTAEETSAVICNDKVIVASNGSTDVYLYDPKIDSMQVIFSHTSAAKVLLKSQKGDVFLLVNGHIFKSSESNLCTWNIVGTLNINLSPQQSSSVEIDDYIYFTMLPFQHYRFHTQLLVVERMII